MIDRNHDLPLVRQAELLRLSRSSLYYEPQPVPTAELAIMRRIDELHLDYPFAAAGCYVICYAARALRLAGSWW
jgi:putative transposase